MHYSLNSNLDTKPNAGFTLIEMLVIAPILIIFIGIIVVMITVVLGESLQSSEKNALAYEVHDALELIETESARSATFPTTTGTLTSPQGSNGSTAAFTVTNNDASSTDTDVLIISTPATTKNPANPTRELIYYNSPNACAATNVTENDYYPVTTVYFVSGGSLWQRTILPSSGTPCSTPWQRSSCAESATLTGVCQTYDNKLVSNVTSFSVQYLNAAGSPVAAANASTAKTVNVTINTNKSVAGKVITYAGSTRSTGLNGVSAAQITPQISAGYMHSCAMVDGNAYCWGRNTYGQLGNNSTTNSSTPVAVTTSGVLSGKTIKAISAGYEHTCAIASDNNAYCWGANSSGQLGNNSTTNSSTPVAVTTSGVLSGKTIKAISAGGYSGPNYGQTCVVASDNNAYCWGNNNNGQLGNNSTTNSSTAVAVTTSGSLSGKTVKSISAGGGITCLIASDDKAYCWGYGWNGAPGSGSSSTYYTPNALSTSGALTSDKTIKVVDAGIDHACAVASDDRVYCWGNGANGQLGSTGYSNAYTPVLAFNAATKIVSAGDRHTCAIASTDNAYCWGDTDSSGGSSYAGSLGTGLSYGSISPVAVSTSGVLSGKTIKSIDSGGQSSNADFTCAIASDNNFYCWGRNNNGQLGTGNTTSQLSPVAVSNFPI